MFRNSAWLLCVFLLCIGHTLSQDAIREVNSEKQTSSSSHPDTNSQAPAGHPNSVPLKDDEQNKTTRTPDPVTKPVTTPEPTTKPVTTPEPTKTTTPKTSPSTPEPPPSTAKPTSPPTKPFSPTAKPTTPNPPPTPPTSSTSTPIPINPTPTPTPPGPQKGNWSVQNDKNITCLLIQGMFSIDYTHKNGTKIEKVHSDVPVKAKAAGTCKPDVGTIELTWNNGTHVNNLKFIFDKNDKTNKYVLSKFAGQIFVPELNETKKFNTDNNVTHFETPVNQSYSCSSTKQIEVNNDTKVTLEGFHLQAFKTSNTTGFDASVDCAGSAEHTPDIVPIIVGCVLALLVIAVLVAYLISRRRSQTRGYLSM